MKVLIIGSGGREHALTWKIKQSKLVRKIYIAPGNAGTAPIGENINITANDLYSLLEFALKEKIDLTIVGPEEPLALGIVDLFNKHNLLIFGPTKKAAQIEASKVFSKRFMKKFNIPTADFKVFSDYQKAKRYLNDCQFPKVLKADGLAAGKGVYVCQTKQKALKALQKIMIEKIFGRAGNKIIIEDCLQGQEVSVICFTDGITILPVLAARDHKPVFDNNQGPNTGGMGAYAPVSLVTQALMGNIVRDILKPTIIGMKKLGCLYRGVLYAGLMITKDGPQVLEYNCRFGDPETQPQLMLLKSDLVKLMISCLKGKINKQKMDWQSGFSVCVVLASKGYPGIYQKGEVIFGLNKIKKPNLQIFQAGTIEKNGQVLTNGGRVLGITSVGKTMKQAIKTAYLVIGKQGVYFKGMHFRSDIGGQYAN